MDSQQADELRPTNSEALSVYGVPTSMALPFILFPPPPSPTHGRALLPTAAEAQADGNEARISSMISSMSLRYSCYMGVLCIGIFTIFGNQLGVSVFHDQNAGTYITILSWLCPFMYLATTMGRSKRPRQDFIHLFPECDCHGHTAGVCVLPFPDTEFWDNARRWSVNWLWPPHEL
ncbi:MAG: hypothetical protein ACLR0U_08560 [Enterocloster clostridioformis]